MHKVTYILLPQDTTNAEYLIVANETYESRNTIGFSADDAGYLVGSGREDSVVIVYEQSRQPEGLVEWFAENYNVTNIKFAQFIEEDEQDEMAEFNNHNLAFGIHGPGSDWRWGQKVFLDKMRRLNMPILYLSNGINQEYVYMSSNLDKTYCRINPNMADFKTPKQMWDEVKDQVDGFYRRGVRKFLVLNEVNYSAEGFGILWDSPLEFSEYLREFVTHIRNDMPRDIKLYFTPYTMTNGGRDFWYDITWFKLRHMFDGFNVHVYANNSLSVEETAHQLRREILHLRDKYLPKHMPMIVSELSVNRGTDSKYKAQVYRMLEDIMKDDGGIESIFYFISQWEHNPEHGENWFDTGLDDEYLKLKV